MPGTARRNIRPGLEVEIVLKEDQKSGKRTHGVVSRILTNKEHHPRGIKVQLTTGEVGRVQAICNRPHPCPDLAAVWGD